MNGDRENRTHRRWHVRKVRDWFVQHTPHQSLRNTVVLLSVLAVINIVLYVLWANAGWPRLWLVSGLIYMGILFERSRNFVGLLDEALNMRDTLSTMSAVFKLLETSPFKQHGPLKQLCTRFHAAAHP